MLSSFLYKNFSKVLKRPVFSLIRVGSSRGKSLCGPLMIFLSCGLCHMCRFSFRLRGQTTLSTQVSSCWSIVWNVTKRPFPVTNNRIHRLLGTIFGIDPRPYGTSRNFDDNQSVAKSVHALPVESQTLTPALPRILLEQENEDVIHSPTAMFRRVILLDSGRFCLCALHTFYACRADCSAGFASEGQSMYSSCSLSVWGGGRI